jgi:hypothetical protein
MEKGEAGCEALGPVSPVEATETETETETEVVQADEVAGKEVTVAEVSEEKDDEENEENAEEPTRPPLGEDGMTGHLRYDKYYLGVRMVDSRLCSQGADIRPLNSSGLEMLGDSFEERGIQKVRLTLLCHLLTSVTSVLQNANLSLKEGISKVVDGFGSEPVLSYTVIDGMHRASAANAKKATSPEFVCVVSTYATCLLTVSSVLVVPFTDLPTRNAGVSGTRYGLRYVRCEFGVK